MGKSTNEKGNNSFDSFIISSAAFAASGGHGHDEGIPVKLIVSQAINFGLLFVLLYFALREKLAGHFKHRAAQYTELVQRAELERQEAEAARKEIQTRLNNLVSTSEQEMQRIRSDAETMKQKIVSDAESLSKKLEEDARQSIAIEVEKAKAAMRSEVLMAAIQGAESGLKTSIKAPEHRKLQNDFVKKMKAVN